MDEKRQLIYSAISSQHFSNIMEKMYFQYKDGRNCDLEIIITDGRIFAHKCMVDIFFTQAGAEIDDDRFVLDLSEFNEHVVEALLDMMYTGELCIQPSLINSLQFAALKLGYVEAEKGCRIYLNTFPRSGSETSDAPVPITVVKTEPVDPDYNDSEAGNASSGSGTEQVWPGGQEDLERLARHYVQNLRKPGRPKQDNPEPPHISSVATSKNIYEVVRKKPKSLKLPDGVVQKASELVRTDPLTATIDTAPALPFRDPFLVVSRDNDGTVVIKKEKNIERISGDSPDSENEGRKTRGRKGRGAKRGAGKTETTVLKHVMSSKGKAHHTIRVPAKPAAEKKNCSTATTTTTTDDSEEEEPGYMPREYLSDEDEFNIYIENAEEDLTPTKTKSGRMSKRPSMYSQLDESPKKRGRPRKNPLPDQLNTDDYIKYLSYDRERRNKFYEKRKKVVIEERHYNNDQFKLVAAAGVVPKGCRSRYGRPELMKTKYITETIQKGDGSVSVRTKEVPRRMTWHERQADKKDAKEPTFVICHPTAPIVRP